MYKIFRGFLLLICYFVFIRGEGSPQPPGYDEIPQLPGEPGWDIGAPGSDVFVYPPPNIINSDDMENLPESHPYSDPRGPIRISDIYSKPWIPPNGVAWQNKLDLYETYRKRRAADASNE